MWQNVHANWQIENNYSQMSYKQWEIEKDPKTTTDRQTPVHAIAFPQKKPIWISLQRFIVLCYLCKIIAYSTRKSSQGLNSEQQCRLFQAMWQRERKIQMAINEWQQIQAHENSQAKHEQCIPLVCAHVPRCILFRSNHIISFVVIVIVVGL